MRLSHRGLCVSDLERSAAFYREALDFADYQDFGAIEGDAELMVIEGSPRVLEMRRLTRNSHPQATLP